mgnify:CR=1 FL=1
MNRAAREAILRQEEANEEALSPGEASPGTSPNTRPDGLVDLGLPEGEIVSWDTVSRLLSENGIDQSERPFYFQAISDKHFIPMVVSRYLLRRPSVYRVVESWGRLHGMHWVYSGEWAAFHAGFAPHEPLSALRVLTDSDPHTLRLSRQVLVVFERAEGWWLDTSPGAHALRMSLGIRQRDIALIIDRLRRRTGQGELGFLEMLAEAEKFLHSLECHERATIESEFRAIADTSRSLSC